METCQDHGVFSHLCCQMPQVDFPSVYSMFLHSPGCSNWAQLVALAQVVVVDSLKDLLYTIYLRDLKVIAFHQTKAGGVTFE